MAVFAEKAYDNDNTHFHFSQDEHCGFDRCSGKSSIETHEGLISDRTSTTTENDQFFVEVVEQVFPGKINCA